MPRLKILKVLSYFIRKKKLLNSEKTFVKKSFAVFVVFFLILLVLENKYLRDFINTCKFFASLNKNIARHN